MLLNFQRQIIFDSSRGELDREGLIDRRNCFWGKLNVYYWSNDFRQAGVPHSQVQVRYDPFDAGLAYAFVQGRWVRCTSEYYARLQGRTEFEVKLATAELRARHQRHARQLKLTARHIAEFIESLEQEEAAQAQLLGAAEGKEVVALINHPPLKGDRANPVGREALAPVQPASEAQGQTTAPEPEGDEPLTPLADYRV